MFNSHLSTGQKPLTVATYKRGENTVITEGTQTRVYINSPISGLRPSEPLMSGQHVNTQFQQRNITSTEPTNCNFNPEIPSPSCHNQYSEVGAGLSSPAPTFFYPARDNTQFTARHRPNEETTTMMMTAGIPHSPNSQFTPRYQFASPNPGMFSQSQPIIGLRLDSPDPLLSSSGFTRSNSIPSNPASPPETTGTLFQNRKLTHFLNHIEANPPQQVSRHQQPVPQRQPLVSRFNAQELSAPATHTLTVRPTPDIGNPGTPMVSSPASTIKSPQLIAAVANSVSHAIIPQLKTDISSIVRAIMPEILREILGEQLKIEVTDAVKAMMPVLQEQINQAAASSITAIITDLQISFIKSVSEAVRPLMETTLEEANKQFLEHVDKMLAETTEKHAKAFEENFSQLQAQQEKTEAASSQTIESLTKAQVTSLQTAEAFKKASTDLKKLVNSQAERQKLAPTINPLNFPQLDQLEATAGSSTSSNRVLETPDSPPAKKIRTSRESSPVADIEVKRNQVIVTKLSNEVSKAMGIKPLHHNECTTGQILLLAAGLINDDKELLVQSAKPRSRRPRTNPNHQERQKSEKDKRRRMQCKINFGLKELENSVRRFSEQHFKEKRPDIDDTPHGIIKEAWSILSDQNKTDPERFSVPRQSLRSAGKSTNLSEYYKNYKALLVQEKSELKNTGSPEKSEAQTTLASQE
ncbi:hypothetical protein [Endozoicomonas sp. YOMI1]|uniref:hypothetical protein n=1 Tax=Endozoicomonas sp. YOMI1 TaxID=2828739 RepID=UPI002148E811|nr:hypothetical protein [Endozoicomonas sp. YOMI1]